MRWSGLWLVVNFIKGPQEFVNVALDGLTRGSIYGVVALGYTLVYGILQLINFAHGDVFSLSGLVASTVLLSVLGLDGDSSNLAVVGGIILTLAITIPLFAVVQRDDRARRLPAAAQRAAADAADHRGRDVLHRLQHLARALRRRLRERLRPASPRARRSRSATINVTWKLVFALAIIVPALIALSWFVGYTRQGKAMRAVAQDTEASAMMGINVNRTISVTFLLAGALAAVAGPRLPPRVQHPLRHRLRARADRLHGGGARRHRQPRRRGRSARS